MEIKTPNPYKSPEQVFSSQAAIKDSTLLIDHITEIITDRKMPYYSAAYILDRVRVILLDSPIYPKPIEIQKERLKYRFNKRQEEQSKTLVKPKALAKKLIKTGKKIKSGEIPVTNSPTA